MPNTRENSAGPPWPNNSDPFIRVRNEEPADKFLHGNGGEMFGVNGRFTSRTPLSENYTVLPVGPGNFLKVYHTNESETPKFNSYELFSSSSITPPENVRSHQNSFENAPQFKSNDTTNMIINQLVTNWSPNLTGTYSPFGEHTPSQSYSLNGDNLPKASNTLNSSKAVGAMTINSSAKTNGSFESNSLNAPELKKRIVAEVKPMRMSYSDVLSKNVAYNSQNNPQTNQQVNLGASDMANQLRNPKMFMDKNKSISQNVVDRKISEEKEKSDFKPKKDLPSLKRDNDTNLSTSSNGQKDKKRISVEERDSSLNQQNKNPKKIQETTKIKARNIQNGNLNTKKRSNKRENSSNESKNASKSTDKECFYNITKNEAVGEKYQKPLPHGNSKKRQVNGAQRNNSRSEKPPHSKRVQKQQRNMKYDLFIKFLEKWYEYMTRILIWLFYLFSDIIVLGCSMVLDRLHAFYSGIYLCCTNLRKDFKNNSGKPNIWMRNIFKKLDGKFKKNSKLAFWRNFYKKKHQEPIGEFYKNGRLPQTGEEAMYSLLNCKGKDAYSILGVSASSPQEQIRKHYKKIAVLVHPDKNKQPGAEEAFKVLQRAFELIGEPENRKSYDLSLAEALHAEKAWTELHDLLSQLQSKIAEAANTIRCSSCGLRHPRKLTERPHYAARECASCKISHSAREGDIWAETSIMGLRWKYFALMEGKVYDITEWANCQKGALSHLQPNSHIVQYRIVRGGQQQQQTVQQEKDRPYKESPSEPSLDEFLDNLYSGQNRQNFSNTSRRRSKKN